MNSCKKFAVILALILLAGCGGNIDETQIIGSIDVRRRPAAIPFVEEVILPEVIYADEYFTVRLKVSSVLEPLLLDGEPEARFLASTGYLKPGGPQGGLISPWMGLSNLTDTGEIMEELVIKHSLPLPVGEWVLGVRSAESREWGGYQCEFELSPTLGPLNPQHVTMTYIPITVVERPAEE